MQVQSNTTTNTQQTKKTLMNTVQTDDISIK